MNHAEKILTAPRWNKSLVCQNAEQVDEVCNQIQVEMETAIDLEYERMKLERQISVMLVKEFEQAARKKFADYGEKGSKSWQWKQDKSDAAWKEVKHLLSKHESYQGEYTEKFLRATMDHVIGHPVSFRVPIAAKYLLRLNYEVLALEKAEKSNVERLLQALPIWSWMQSDEQTGLKSRFAGTIIAAVGNPSKIKIPSGNRRTKKHDMVKQFLQLGMDETVTGFERQCRRRGASISYNPKFARVLWSGTSEGWSRCNIVREPSIGKDDPYQPSAKRDNTHTRYFMKSWDLERSKHPEAQAWLIRRKVMRKVRARMVKQFILEWDRLTPA